MDEAESIELPYRLAVETTVKPERQKVTEGLLRERWWQYAENAAGACGGRFADLDEVLVIALVEQARDAGSGADRPSV